MSRNYYVINPNAQPSDGKISYDNNSTNLTFNIQESNSEMYVGGSMKLTFTFKIFDGNTLEQAIEQVAVSPQCGHHGLIQSVDVFSYSTNTSLHSTKQYGRLVSSVYSVGMADLYDVSNGLQQSAFSNGIEYNGANVGIYNSGAPSEPQAYSLRPLVGLLEQNLYLGNTLRQGTGGLKCNFVLQSNGNFLTRMDNPNTGYTYELENVRLMYQTITMTDEEQSAGMLKNDFVSSYVDMVRNMDNRQPSRDEIESNWSRRASSNNAPVKWRDYSGYLATIESDNANVNLNIGLSKVHSVFANFIQSDYLNNLGTDLADSNKTYEILDTNNDVVPFDKVVFTKGNQLFPYRYGLSSNISEQNYVAADDHTSDTRAEIVKSYLDSVVPYVDNKYQQASIGNSLWFNQYRPYVAEDECGGKGAGLGFNCSVLNGSSDFQFQPLGIQVDSKNPGTFQNTSCFVYALAEREMNWSNGAISVSS
jgi:hypothetical protein